MAISSLDERLAHTSRFLAHGLQQPLARSGAPQEAAWSPPSRESSTASESADSLSESRPRASSSAARQDEVLQLAATPALPAPSRPAEQEAGVSLPRARESGTTAKPAAQQCLGRLLWAGILAIAVASLVVGVQQDDTEISGVWSAKSWLISTGAVGLLLVTCRLLQQYTEHRSLLATYIDLLSFGFVLFEAVALINGAVQSSRYINSGQATSPISAFQVILAVDWVIFILCVLLEAAISWGFLG
eukprot:g12070.t1